MNSDDLVLTLAGACWRDYVETMRGGDTRSMPLDFVGSWFSANVQVRLSDKEWSDLLSDVCKKLVDQGKIRYH